MTQKQQFTRPKYKEEKANIKKAESASLTDEELKKTAGDIRAGSVSAIPDEPVSAAADSGSYRQAGSDSPRRTMR